MRCIDVMRQPVQVCRDSESVAVAARRMRDGNIGFLPVVGADGRTLGVLTDRDIVVRVCAEGHSARRTAVKDAMTVGVVACGPLDDLTTVQELMRRHRKSRVLVQEVDGHPVGVVSIADLAQHMEPETARTLRAVVRREVLETSS